MRPLYIKRSTLILFFLVWSLVFRLIYILFHSIIHDFSFTLKMQSTFFALSAQQEPRQVEIELGCCWTAGAEIARVDNWVWPAGCTPPVPLSPPPLPTALPVASSVRQLDAESPHPSMTLQPCCSHPEILTFLPNLRLTVQIYLCLSLFMRKKDFRQRVLTVSLWYAWDIIEKS